MKSLGKQFIASIIDAEEVAKLLKLGKCDYLFEHAEFEGTLFKALSDHLSKYGYLPSRNTFEEITGEDLPEVEDSPEYYRDRLHERHVHRTIVKLGDEINEALNDKKPMDALALLSGTSRKLELEFLYPQLFDFRDSHDKLMQAIANKIAPEGTGNLELGWTTFDNMSGGLGGGDLISMVGRPAQGKTFKLLYTAMHAWREQKKNVLFVSMEMIPIKIFERLSAIYSHMPMNWIKKGEFATLKTNQLKKYSNYMLEIAKQNNFFYVVDGNLTASIDDIRVLCAQLNPDVVYVDGAYLIQSNAWSKHEKIAQVTEGLKQTIATKGNIPVVASYQFNRDSMKLKKDEMPGLEHIAGSDAIGQLSSLVLGLFQEETVETIHSREVRILKGREGEVGSFYTNWDFIKMDFSEIKKDHDKIILN